MITAEVVALEQAFVLNRLGAFNPAGMLYALREDVVFQDGSSVSDEKWTVAPGRVELRPGKRPRPLVLRVNEGDCLQVTLHNLLARAASEETSGGPAIYGGKVVGHSQDAPGLVYPDKGRSGRELVKPTAISNDAPATRGVTFHVTGLEYQALGAAECPLSTNQHEWVCGYGQGDVGRNESVVHPATPEPLRSVLKAQGGTVQPGQSAVYRFRATREGTYFAYSNAATVGGEGDGGQLGLGLFGAVNVEPKASKWYRSQVTHEDLLAATRSGGAGHPYREVDYDGARYTSGPRRGVPILAMLDGDRIIHADVNAVVALLGPTPDHNDTTGPDRSCAGYAMGNSCGRAYREFTVILHDEVKAVQAFAELEEEDNPLAALKDGMGINYGTGGMGAMVLARNRKTGPARDCPECRAEEFFLSSWVNGDPALVLKWDAAGKVPAGALYPDDPSNVHHSYLNDPVRFRNLHAGPKETHVFHLHSHQWVMDPSQPGSSYLDSQTISPGAGFSYEIAFGGGGNRNLTPGDSIFHCHLYPHFAQGMWELWRVHDVFEDGTPGLFDGSRNPRGRNLPDAEVSTGIENPAVVPLPGTPLPPMPTPVFRGYPFYIAAEAGHRPSQPPLDHDVGEDGVIVDGGLPRHYLTSARPGANRTRPAVTETRLVNQDVVEEALAKGGLTARINAAKVYAQNPKALTTLAEVWEQIGSVAYPEHAGTEAERTAMDFHAGQLELPGHAKVRPAEPRPGQEDWERERRGYQTELAARVAGQAASAEPPVFLVNGRSPKPGAPYADPCPAAAAARTRGYKTAFIQTELTVNKHGWFDPQARMVALEKDVQDIIDPKTRIKMPEPLFFRANSGECIEYKSSNLIPNALALDDFQMYTPTDTVGQHIHLVKFDVTSSDGSGNGWNYEDGTFSPEEVQERVFAINKARADEGIASRLPLRTHPLFQAVCESGDRLCEALRAQGQCPAPGEAVDRHELRRKHPFCGAQRTVQRWYADPLLNGGKDHTLRTVFTHDHFGPSSHQQHGLYAALVIEPANSVWLPLNKATIDWDALCAAAPKDRQTLLIGGANLSDRHDEMCRSRALAGVGAGERRPPVKLRDDGGPTATRANIVAPKCIGRLDSSPANPAWKPQETDCAGTGETQQTRREFMLAFADFGIVYNTALEPINPEKRDESALRLGQRFVARNLAAPLAISSEDPGSQFINYRHEPVPLRITDVRPDSEAPELGGFRYSQTRCEPAAADEKTRLTCTGDPANVMSTLAHAERDKRLANEDYRTFIGAPATPRVELVSALTRSALSRPEARDLDGQPLAAKLSEALDDIEGWRKDFNCSLYSDLPGLRSDCRAGLSRGDPWRQFGDPATPILPAYEGDRVQLRLVQGAQEAQHVFGMNGIRWLREPDQARSGWVAAQPLGISEHFEFDVRPNPNSAARLDYLYAGTSVDQLWDGLWGVMRVFGRVRTAPAAGTFTLNEQSGIASLFKLKGTPIREPATSTWSNRQEQMCAGADRRMLFDVAAVRACELAGGCGDPSLPARRGLVYNQRHQLEDPDAIVFVRVNEDDDAAYSSAGNSQVLSELGLRYAPGSGRQIEPLVLRAAAGTCVQVKLRNLLPATLPDGPLRSSIGEDSTAHFGNNFMSMITDGFNVNQFRMSSSIGLSAPMVAQHLSGSDGSNVGINSDDVASLGKWQGSLVPPCRAGSPSGPCSTEYTWYAGDFDVGAAGAPVVRPIELGALPLRSFGDPLKHPMHGAVGALVIGPRSSRVCAGPEYGDARELAADRGTALSANICDTGGRLLYRDLVAVLQDAVEMRQEGRPLANLKGAEEPDDYGAKAVNYRTEPLWARRGGDPSMPFEERNTFDYSSVLSAKGFRSASGEWLCRAKVRYMTEWGAERACEPETPVFVARAGRELRLHLVHPGGHTRQQAISLAGHRFSPYPFADGSDALLATADEAVDAAWIVQGHVNGLAPMMSASLLVKAGGSLGLPMDYLWRSQASFIFDGGLWGLLRVLPATP